MAMIQITFTPETPEQAAVVAEAIGKYLGAVVAPAATEKEPAAEAPKRQRVTKANTSAPATVASEPTPETPQSESAPASEADAGNAPAADSTPAATEETKDSNVSSTTSVTLEEVRGFLASLSQAGKGAEVKDLIAKFGAAKLTDIDSAKYGELLAAAQEL